MRLLRSAPGSTRLIAMLHVPSNNALTNTVYNDGFGVSSYGPKDLATLEHIRQSLRILDKKVQEKTGVDILGDCRTASFVLFSQDVKSLMKRLAEIPFVRELEGRALRETEIFVRNGIDIVEIENVGAPYFMGNQVPLEDLLILHHICQRVREQFPELNIGLHVLSSDDIESLPIAIECDASFIRSESSMFYGLRPEGPTINRGGLAKFFYFRNLLNAYKGISDPAQRRFPAIWTDLQKKHTVFNSEIQDLKTWLDNLMFVKIEGTIVSGLETGSDVSEADLLRTREAIELVKKNTAAFFENTVDFDLPLITGSGMNIELYKKYADFVIVGTQLKKAKYWENPVDEENVKQLLARFYG